MIDTFRNIYLKYKFMEKFNKKNIFIFIFSLKI